MSLLVHEVPCKSSFDLLQVTLENIRDGWSPEHLAWEVAQHRRHGNLLNENAVILGFARRQNGKLVLTKSGSEYLEVSPEKKALMVAKAMLESRVMTIVIKHAGSIAKARRMTKEQICNLLLQNAVVSREDGKQIGRTTADRRAGSVKSWISWLDRSISRLGGNDLKELRLAEQRILTLHE